MADGTEVFVKTHPNPPQGMFSAEARGLEWLDEANALRVPQVLAVSEEYFVVEGYDWFRVRFYRENGGLRGFEEVRTDGSSVRCRRE